MDACGEPIVKAVTGVGRHGTADDGAEPERFLVVVNWFEELRERVGGVGRHGTADDGAEPERFLVVVNWFEELRERVGN